MSSDCVGSRTFNDLSKQKSITYICTSEPRGAKLYDELGEIIMKYNTVLSRPPLNDYLLASRKVSFPEVKSMNSVEQEEINFSLSFHLSYFLKENLILLQIKYGLMLHNPLEMTICIYTF